MENAVQYTKLGRKYTKHNLVPLMGVQLEYEITYKCSYILNKLHLHELKLKHKLYNKPYYYRKMHS